jgi:regulator-associated protein of mTOR
LKWFCTQSIISGVDQDQVDKIPGHLTDRRTPYGELNWIFTAITDTIAWNALPAELFQRLFRQDLLVASLFRNFLLAERIMRCCKATPVSHPKLPPTYNHPMWQAWDLAADHCLAQLPQLISDPTYEYRHSTFFTEQLTAFEVWLEFGTEDKNPPEQLPIVLQVLLSPQHRSRALDLLARFLDLGPWAVNQALSVGIFPYVLKLLQSPAAELRKTLVFIWAKILALDQSCQIDLVKDNGQQYFINVLSNHEHSVQELQLSAFVLSIICNNHKAGQIACLNAKLLQICLGHLSSLDADVRRYVVLAMAKLWENHEEGKKQAIKEKIHEKLCSLLSDPVAEVRAAAVYALGTFIGRSGVSSADREQRDMIEYRLGLTFAVVTADSSPLVRKELVISLSALVNAYEEKFRIIAKTSLKQEQLAEAKRKKKMKSEDSGDLQPEIEENHIYEFLWKLILSLANDPFPVVAQMAILVIKKIKDQAYDELQKVPSSIIPNNSIPKPPNEESSKSIKPPKIKKPLSSFFAGGPKSQNPQSPGPTLSTGRAPIPQVTWNEKIQQAMEGAEIKSSFYDWSCQRYSQSTLRIDDEDETAHAFNERKWRIQRNLEMIKEAEKIKDDTQFAVNSLDNEIAILENDNQVVSQLRFHPFENIVVVADERDSIAVWNWESGQPILHFNNQNPPGSRITSLHLLNENDNLLIAVGSDDAVVRVWGGVYKPENLHLVTAWRALGPDAEQNNLVLEWQQKNELMIASGSIDILKVWDVNRELFLQDIPTTINQPVTCMVSDKWDNRNLIIAGFWDGSVRTYDRRIGGKYSMVNQLTDPTNSTTVKRSVVNVFLPIRGQIVYGTTTGEIKFWDVRQAKSSVRTLTADKKGEQVLTALAVHDYAPIIAMGQEQRIKVMNLTTESSVFIRYHDGFL